MNIVELTQTFYRPGAVRVRQLCTDTGYVEKSREIDRVGRCTQAFLKEFRCKYDSEIVMRAQDSIGILWHSAKIKTTAPPAPARPTNAK